MKLSNAALWACAEQLGATPEPAHQSAWLALLSAPDQGAGRLAILRLTKRVGPEIESVSQARDAALAEHAKPTGEQGRFNLTPAFALAFRGILSGETDEIAFSPLTMDQVPASLTALQVMRLQAAGLVQDTPEPPSEP